MRRAFLIVNPRAGRAALLQTQLPLLTRILEAAGIHAIVRETSAAPDSARLLAAEAAQTSDLVLACGGDGTVHGVVQGVARTGATLGALPFGTANALARNLGLSLDPAAALHQLLAFTPRRIPLGEATTATSTRWFTVMAGAGPDGTLVHGMQSAAKSRFGRRTYYAEAARLFLTRRFPAFRVEYKPAGSSAWRTHCAVAMMASRVPDLGGLFRGLTPGSRLDHPHLRVQLLAPRAGLALPAWFAFSRVGLHTRNPWLTTVEAQELRCSPPRDPATAAHRPVHAQVDGEAAGLLPLSLRVVPDALSLLMP